MFDLNAIVNAALQQAVAEAIKPLVERITALESNLQDALVLRLAALENNPAIGTDTVLAERVKALEERVANATEASEARIRVIAEAAAEQAMDDHCSTYDHDEYDNVVSNWNDEDPTEFVKDGDLSSQINDVLHGASFDVRIRL
jgi:hypothetical protein